MVELLWILAGLVIGGAVVAVVFLLRRSSLDVRLSNAQSRAALLDEEIARRDDHIERIERERDEIDQKREDAERRAAVLESKLKSHEEMEKQLSAVFDSLSSKALRENTKQFFEQASEKFKTVLDQFKGEDEKTKQAIDHLVKPIREMLDRQNETLAAIEKRRLEDRTGLTEQLKMIAQSHQRLSFETAQLVKALRRPEQRGRWGEVQLRNVVELAGMTEHCDFFEQPPTDDPESRRRPDMIVNLPGGGVIVVDSKVALDAYLDALECQDEESRTECFLRHARHVETHFRELAKRQYWDQFERTPKLVVMFVRLESALMAALERKPGLHADAMENHVLIATPTLLVALLRAVAYGWQQEALAANAREISQVGKELYDRLATFVSHFETVGKNLDRSTRAYNRAVGSLDRMVLSSTRKLRDLQVTTDAEIESPPQIDREVREFVSAELKPLPENPATAETS